MFAIGSVSLVGFRGSVRGHSRLKNTAPDDKSDICKSFRSPFGSPVSKSLLKNTAPADKSDVPRFENIAPVHESTLSPIRSHSKTPRLSTNPTFRSSETVHMSQTHFEALPQPLENIAPVTNPSFEAISSVSAGAPRPAGTILELPKLKNTAPADKSSICKSFRGPFSKLGLENALGNAASADKSNVARLENTAPL